MPKKKLKLGEKKVLNLPSVRLPIKPLTLTELDKSISRRVHAINKEFKKGFDFVKKHEKSVTFFGSARTKKGDPNYKTAEKLAARLAALDYAIVTGGGPGIMEAANKGAKEVGGHSLGLNIRLPKEQVRNPYQTESEDFYYFFIRKVCLTYSAEAFIYFPGGFGTLDEFFEIITLVQTNKIRKVPIILVGKKYWKDFAKLLEKKLSKEAKYIDKSDLDLFKICDDLDEVVEIVKKVKVLRGDGN